jgi:protein-tyrosine-phosphatase, low molecular weight
VGAWESGASRHSEETRGARHFRKRACVTDVGPTDLDADYILGMDASNVRNIHAFVDGKSDATVARLLEVAGVQRDIADPWYTGDFDATYRDVTLGCNALLEQLKKEL